MDPAAVLADAHKEIAEHRQDNSGLDITVLDLGVINSEHFPFNVSGCVASCHPVLNAWQW